MESWWKVAPEMVRATIDSGYDPNQIGRRFTPADGVGAGRRSATARRSRLPDTPAHVCTQASRAKVTRERFRFDVTCHLQVIFLRCFGSYFRDTDANHA